LTVVLVCASHRRLLARDPYQKWWCLVIPNTLTITWTEQEGPDTRERRILTSTQVVNLSVLGHAYNDEAVVAAVYRLVRAEVEREKQIINWEGR
jgi:hypothetical protein